MRVRIFDLFPHDHKFITSNNIKDYDKEEAEASVGADQRTTEARAATQACTAPLLPSAPVPQCEAPFCNAAQATGVRDSFLVRSALAETADEGPSGGDIFLDSPTNSHCREDSSEANSIISV